LGEKAERPFRFDPFDSAYSHDLFGELGNRCATIVKAFNGLPLAIDHVRRNSECLFSRYRFDPGRGGRCTVVIDCAS
jgi:hypothetical protein